MPAKLFLGGGACKKDYVIIYLHGNFCFEFLVVVCPQAAQRKLSDMQSALNDLMYMHLQSQPTTGPAPSRRTVASLAQFSSMTIVDAVVCRPMKPGLVDLLRSLLMAGPGCFNYHHFSSYIHCIYIFWFGGHHSTDNNLEVRMATPLRM